MILVKCRARFNRISDAEKITTSKEPEGMQGSPGKTFVLRNGNGIGLKIPYFRGDRDRNDLDPSFNNMAILK